MTTIVAIPETMRAVVLTGVGGLDKLEMRKAPTPRPGPYEALISVKACGLNNSDVMLRIGGYGREDDPQALTSWKRDTPVFPRIQGSDVAGTIVAVGEQADAQRIGEKVLVNPTLYRNNGNDVADVDYLGSDRDGGYADYCVVPIANAHRIDSNLPFEDLATFPIAYLTALHMLNRARLQAGETIVVSGASGGVGSALVQLAVARGAKVVALIGAGKENHAFALGASIAIVRNDPLLDETLKEIPNGIDVVADVVGGPLFTLLLSALKATGRLVTCGAIGGANVTLDLRTVYLKHLQIIGSSYGAEQEFAELVHMIEKGAVKPLRAATYPLEKLAEAQSVFMQKKHFGNIVVVP
jgi:NADPH:quinone reductase-like Zn-dependent oxidoreductase